METAVLTTRTAASTDTTARSRGHQDSIRENLRKKSSFRGASTISMQLAKNLYLDRGKNLSRQAPGGGAHDVPET